MATKFTLTGIAVRYGFDDSPVSVVPTTFEAVFPDDQAFFNYNVISASSGELPEVEIDGTVPISSTLNGTPLNESFEEYLGFIQTSQGTHIILSFFDPMNSTDHIFQVGGDPLTVPTTVAQFNALDDSFSNVGIATGAFAPGQNILLSSVPGFQIEDVSGDGNTIVGTNDDDVLIGTSGDDLIITGDATSDGDYVRGSLGNDTIDVSGINDFDGFVTIDYSSIPGPISVAINCAAKAYPLHSGSTRC